MFSRAATARRKPSSAGIPVPAPMGSLNAFDSLKAMPAEDCIVRYNLIPAEFGLRTRLGSREWVTGLDGPIRSMLSFTAQVSTSNKVFATTETGIWDVTSSNGVWVTLAAGAGPVGARFYTVSAVVGGNEKLLGPEINAGDVTDQTPTVGWTAYPAATAYRVYITDTSGVYTGYYEVAAPTTSLAESGPLILTPAAIPTTYWYQAVVFGTQDATSGHGVCCTMVTSAGHFLVYADESNGAYVYTESTATWAAMTLTGVDAGDIVHVQTFKNRLWLTERDSGKLWYLPLNAISGTATSLNVGARFKAGGAVRGCWSWTYDGGAGIDDSLVVVSDGGDVLVYQGTDPSIAGLWQLRGVWQIGALPAGRRIASDVGGDLILMSRLGLVPMSRLVLGAIQGDATQYATGKIQALWNKWMLSRASTRGWAMEIHPEDGTLIVIAPNGETTASDQLVMSVGRKVWSQYRNLGMHNAMCSHEGKLYFGGYDSTATTGTVYIMDGNVDGVTLADPTSYSAIDFSLLTAFTNLGNARQKRVHMVRPSFIWDTSAPTYSVAVRTMWDLSEGVTGATATQAGANTWDTGKWDSAVWGSDSGTTTSINGTTGIGPEFAIALRGTATSRCSLIGFDVFVDEGGWL